MKNHSAKSNVVTVTGFKLILSEGEEPRIAAYLRNKKEEMKESKASIVLLADSYSLHLEFRGSFHYTQRSGQIFALNK